MYQKTEHNLGDVITMVEEKEEEVSCVTRFSNPAPLIQWFLGDAQLTNATQTNVSELEEPRKWRSESRLRHKFVKEDLGRRLRCVVQHEAYRYKQDDTHVSIDVLCEF